MLPSYNKYLTHFSCVISNLFDQLGKAKIYMKINLQKGYYMVMRIIEGDDIINLSSQEDQVRVVYLMSWGLFDELKTVIYEKLVLALPNFAKTFEIHTDASDFAIEGVLM